MSCLNTLTVINREKKWHELSRMREIRIFGGHNFLHKKRKFLLLNDKITTFKSFYYNLEFFEYRLKNVWNHVKNLLRITRLEENFVIITKKTQCMHCFLQYGQGCMWRIRIIHLWRPHGGDVWVVGKNWQALHLFNDYLRNKIPG